jgi:putative ABC transport system permease protein
MRDRVARVWGEARYGFRLLRRDPGYAVIVALTLALGIGATTAIFSVLYASILAPLPFPDSDRLYIAEIRNVEGNGGSVDFERLETWRQETRTVDGAAYIYMGQLNFTMSIDGVAEQIDVEQVDLETLRILGVQPVLGRVFAPDETIVEGNTSATIVISHDLWQRAFGGDPDVLGRPLPGWTASWGNTVIGVMPPGFYTHPSRSNSDAWYVITTNVGQPLARLAHSVHPDQAAAELESLLSGPDIPDGPWRVTMTEFRDVFRGGFGAPVQMLIGAVLFVLLIASVNVANMQLSRGVQRQAEMATRAAMGAGRGSLFGQLLAESVPMMAVGGLIGVLIAFLGIFLFVLVAPNFYPPSQEITVNGPVLVFAVVISCVAGVLAGVVPGFHASKPDLANTLKEGGRGVIGRGRLGLRRGLVITEVALAMVLLVGAGLMITSYARMTNVDMGLDPDNVLTLEINLFGMDRYRIRAPNDWTATPEVSRFYTTALERLRALPGVVSVASTSNLPPRGGNFLPFEIAGRPAADERPGTAYHEVSPGYFETLRIPIVRGRAFTDLDSQSAPGVAIVNETLAREYFGAEDPIGQRIRVEMNSQNPELEDDREREIVGVVQDTRMSFTQDPFPTLYIPYLQALDHYASNFLIAIHAQHQFAIRTTGDPEAIVTPVRRAFAETDDSVAVSAIMPMRDRLGQVAGAQQYWMRLLGIFAFLGTVLAATGIYGVISYAVEQRTHEFGIRTTLGAGPLDILRLVVWEGLFVTSIGLAIGVAGTFAATRVIANQLYGVGAMDPATIVAVVFVLLLVGLLACSIPGWRATRLDPSIALRTE